MLVLKVLGVIIGAPILAMIIQYVLEPIIKFILGLVKLVLFTPVLVVLLILVIFNKDYKDALIASILMMVHKEKKKK